MKVTITTDSGEVLEQVESNWTDNQLVQSTDRKEHYLELKGQVEEALEHEWEAMCLRYERGQREQQKQRAQQTESLELTGGNTVPSPQTVRICSHCGSETMTTFKGLCFSCSDAKVGDKCDSNHGA